MVRVGGGLPQPTARGPLLSQPRRSVALPLQADACPLPYPHRFTEATAFAAQSEWRGRLQKLLAALLRAPGHPWA